MELGDTIRHPGHYEVYPVQPIEITRHLGFCLGNAVKYVLRAPWKGGAEDCDKALRYLEWLKETPQVPLYHDAYVNCDYAIKRLIGFFIQASGDQLWQDVSRWQEEFVWALQSQIKIPGGDYGIQVMAKSARELKRVLTLRDTTGQIYEGLTGLPEKGDE